MRTGLYKRSLCKVEVREENKVVSNVIDSAEES